MKLNKVIIFFLTFLFLMTLAGSSSKASMVNKNVKLSEFITDLQGNQFSYVKFTNNVAVGEKVDGGKMRTTFPEYYINNFIDLLSKRDIQFEFISAESQKTFLERILTILFFIIQWLPMLIISWVMIAPFIKRKGGDAKDNNAGGFMGMNPFNFGRSKARAIMPDELKVKFQDVAGIDEAKEDLVEIVDFLREPEKYIKIGAKIPKGCLLIGQPGTGKTLLAKAIASEARVPFFFISGSDFVEMFVGVGASRVRDMFAQAKKQAPCIIFIDEIDAVGRHRGVGIGGGNDEREQTLNQMLVEMDGFTENAGIVVIAATNRVDVLDPALLRPGRFDRQIHVSLPDIKGRREILEVHASKVKLANNADLVAIARGTPGFSGADLANLINEAALLAARNGNRIVTTEFLEMAKDKILMGPERKSMVMLEKEKKLTAYHEAGHAILALNLPHSDPIHKATIMPRGRALGLVMRLPESDRLSMTKMEMIANIKVAMGGRIAEEIIFGAENVTSGASSDIEQITKIARDMITKWGLGASLGMINYSNVQKERYEGDASARADISEKTSEIIDTEIKLLVDKCYNESKAMLEEKIEDLDLLAKTLLQYETLTGDEIRALIIDKISIEEIKNNNEDDLMNKKKQSSFASVKKKSSNN